MNRSVALDETGPECIYNQSHSNQGEDLTLFCLEPIHDVLPAHLTK